MPIAFPRVHKLPNNPLLHNGSNRIHYSSKGLTFELRRNQFQGSCDGN